jgi:YjbE family integral membrane protein
MDILGLAPSVFFAQLLGIILTDLLLCADNAIVIGMACRNLPERLRMKGIVLGTVGALVVRLAATLIIVWLMNLDFVRLVGGAALVFIGCKLMVKEEAGADIKAANSLLSAVATVIAADAIMGIDNIMAVAGISDGHSVMVIIGLCISVPVMVFGSTFVAKLMDRFAFIVYIGAAVILYAAARMIVEEKVTAAWFDEHDIVRWIVIIAITGGGLLFGFLYNRRKTGRG